MRIVFYSTNSNLFAPDSMIFTTIPSFENQWENFCKAHPQDNFFIVTQKPGMFLPQNNKTIFLETQNTKEITKAILDCKPDLAIAFSFWTVPFDWLPVKDSLVAAELETCGVKVVCHSVETTSTCFDKWETSHFLEKNNFKHAHGILIKHDLYFCAGNQKDVLTNVYKESVLEQIQKMKFPLIIKDNVGLSSYGISIANTFGEVTNYLNSKKNNSDRIVEEYISGEQYGTEIYGAEGNYTILPPLKFSLNKYGITSPKLSTKTGPFYEHFDTLQSELIRLAKLMHFTGAVQVDLVLHNKEWYIIEINPRLSGMTMTYSAACNLSVYEIMYRCCVLHEKINTKEMKTVINQKQPLMTNTELQNFVPKSNCAYISQIENKAAKQEREKGYCEVISIRE